MVKLHEIQFEQGVCTIDGREINESIKRREEWLRRHHLTKFDKLVNEKLVWGVFLLLPFVFFAAIPILLIGRSRRRKAVHDFNIFES